MQDRSNIFLSYSRADSDFALAIARDLEALGINVWIDMERIAIGESWSQAIQRALDESYAMVLVLSPESMASKHVQDEYTYFLDDGKPIVPIMYRNTRLHFQLNRLQWIDFTTGDAEASYNNLIRALYEAGVNFNAPAEVRDTPRSSSHTITHTRQREADEETSSTRRRFRLAGIILAGLVGLVAGILAISSLIGDSDSDVQSTPLPTLEFVVGRVLSADALMYEQPSRDSRTLDVSFSANDPVIVRQRTADNRFLFVEFGREQGWMFAADIAAENTNQIGIAISPTPSLTPTATIFVTPTPTVTPFPTPEQVTPIPTNCVVTILPDGGTATVHFEPSFLGFSEFDTAFPGESFIATARSGINWYYITIGWINLGGGNVQLLNETVCDALPEDQTLNPGRIRATLRDLPLVQQLVTNPGSPSQPITTDGLEGDALAIAEAWNTYGSMLETLSELLDVDEALLLAVIFDEVRVEDNSDLLPIRFEADLFQANISKEEEVDFDTFFLLEEGQQQLYRSDKDAPYVAFNADTALAWAAFGLARTINEGAALLAIRYGETGVVGSRFIQVGFSTPLEMFEALADDAKVRIIAKLDDVKNQPGALEALRAGDLNAFGAAYSQEVGATLATNAQTYFNLFSSLR